MKKHLLIFLIISVFSLNSCKNSEKQDLLIKANELADRGEFSKALSIYGEIIEKHPTFAPAYAKRGAVLNVFKNYEAALLELNKAIQLDSSKSEFYIIRGSAREQLNDIQGAISDYNTAIDRDSNYLAFNNLGMLKMSMESYKESMYYFDKSIEINASASMTYNNRGSLKEKMGLSRDAIADYNLALSIAPAVALYYYNRSISRYSLGDLLGTIEDLSKAIELKPNGAEYYYYRGLVWKEIGSIKKSCDDFKVAYELGIKDAYIKLKEVCG